MGWLTFLFGCVDPKMSTDPGNHVESKPDLENGKLEYNGLGLLTSPERNVRSEHIGIGTPNSDPELITSAEVTIREPTTEELTSIGGVLRYCKRRILYPYLRLLAIMGLKPLGIPGPEAYTCAMVINKFYVGCVTILLLIGYVLQYLTCYRRDRGFSHGTSDTLRAFDFADQGANSTTICDGNPISSHLFPSLLHFGSFVYMVYLYRINEDEQLPNLMERVFIQASQAHSNLFSQKKLLRTLQLMVGFSASWVLLATASQALQLASHSFNLIPWPTLRKDIKDGLIFTMALSGLWQDAIQVTLLVSYCIHCRLLSTYFNLIHSRIQEHSISLGECIKEIGELDKLLHYLNSDLAPGVGPLLIMDSTFAVSSILFIYQKAVILEVLDLISLCLIATLWILINILTMSESVKLTISCSKIRELGNLVRMRPFGYQDTPQADLDSFLLFVSSLGLRVHICRVPVSPEIIAFSIGTAVTMFLLWGLIFI